MHCHPDKFENTKALVARWSVDPKKRLPSNHQPLTENHSQSPEMGFEAGDCALFP